MLSVSNISKSYGALQANSNISFQLEDGKVLTLMGENGAGKTTLMRIIYGLETMDSGEIAIDGQRVQIKSPRDAIRYGIGMVHQHFMLVNHFTVAENLIFGMKEATGRFLNMKRINQEVKEFFAQYNFDLDPERLVGTLPVGLQQRVEIMKALFRGAKTLVLDEPTAVLTPQETVELFKIIRQLVAQGKSVIFISHKMNEVMEISDEILVLRLGKVMGVLDKNITTKEELIRLMVGRELKSLSKRSMPPLEERRPYLQIRNLRVKNEKKDCVKNLSLSVWKNEILGIAGVDGNGQKELIEAITGLRKVYSGEILVHGQAIQNKTPKQARQAGVAHIPEDRRKRGLILPFDLVSNYMLVQHDQAPFSHFGFINRDYATQYARKLTQVYQVKAGAVSETAASLSGGNQQKVIVAREIELGTDVLLAVKPTRGVDVGAVEYLHNCLLRERDKGKAILLVSSELEEIMQLADRIAVMHEGELMGLVYPDKVNEQELGLMMTGAVQDYSALLPEEEIHNAVDMA